VNVAVKKASPTRVTTEGKSDALDVRSLNRATLARQMLLEHHAVSALAAVEQHVALQAQVAWPPFVGLWSRVKSFHRQELQRLVETKQVVRAPFLRATLHLVSARDYRALRPALDPMMARAVQALGERTRGIDVEEVVAAARAFLAQGPADLDAVRAHLVTRWPKADARAMGFAAHLLLHLVNVPDGGPWSFEAGSDVTLAEAWLGAPVNGSGAAHELVKRYLAAFGPATVADFQAWSALQGAKTVFEELRGELVTFRDDKKRELFDVPDAPRPGPDVPAPVRFLPDFDSLVLGHQDRSRLMDDAHRKLIVTKNLLVRATFLVDGRVSGMWKVERKKSHATLSLQPFVTIAARVKRELEEEGTRLLAFTDPDAKNVSVLVSA
jgi:hypothetical protein